MKALIIMLMTGCAVVAVICLAVRMGVPPQCWLWITGLAGPVIGALQFVLQCVRKLVAHDNRSPRSEAGQRKIRPL